MRFVELKPDSAREGFNLHPRINLLRGVDPAGRVALVGFLHSIAAGDTFDWEGTVEVHGIEMTLPGMLDLVGATADAALIVEAATLIDIARDPAGELTEEGLAFRSAVEAREKLQAEVVDLAEELSGANQIRTEMSGRLASAEARIDRTAARCLDLADGDLGRAAKLAERPDPWTGMAEPVSRVTELEGLADELDQRLANLPAGDRAALAAATATARAASSSGPVPAPEAQALGEAWMSLHQRLVGLESRMEASGGGTEAVAIRLDRARAAARLAEDAAVPRSVRADESDHLEVLHERVINLEQRSGRSIRRGAAQREFEAARAELNHALEDIGYPTWAAFRMGNGMASVSQDKLADYDRCRIELEAAETEWAELMARLERDTDLQAVLNGIDAALEHAVDILGYDPYADADSEDPEVLAGELRAVNVDAGSTGVELPDALSHLRSVLDESGSIGQGELADSAGLVVLGDTWLGVLRAADEAAVRLLRDRERLSAELKELILLGAGSRVDRLDSERTKVHRAEADVAELRSALLDVSQVRLELHMLAATELSVAEEHDAKLELSEGAKVLERLAEHKLVQTSGDNRGLAAVAARIPRGTGGAVPLVVLMGDAPIDSLDNLLGLPEDVQVLVIGDADGLEEWGDGQGPYVVGRVDLPQLV